MTGAARSTRSSPHNYGALPARTRIESVLAQSHRDLEIVVVDDGSTDDTAAVVGGLREPRRPLRPADRTAAPARPATRACEATSAPLVAFLDADDAWLPDRVAAGVAHLERHPELALVAAHAFACDEALRPPAVVHAAARPACGSVSRSCSSTTSCSTRARCSSGASALEAAGGFSELPIGEDWDTWLEIAKRYPIGFVDRAAGPRPPPRGELLAADGRARLDVQPPIVERHLDAFQPAWKRPLIRRRRAPRWRTSTPAWAARSRAATGARRGGYALTALALDPFTLARRKVDAAGARVRLESPVRASRPCGPALGGGTR